MTHVRLGGLKGNGHKQMRGFDLANPTQYKCEIKSPCDWQDGELGKTILEGSNKERSGFERPFEIKP